MGQFSVWKCKFHVEATPGRVTSGPYITTAGISGGTRGDIQSPSTLASLVTAISNNLLGILQAQGFAGTVKPAGTVVIDDAEHVADAADIWT